MQGDAYADHAGSAGNVGNAYVGPVEGEGGGYFPRQCDNAFGNAFRRGGSAVGQEKAAWFVDGGVGAHHVIMRCIGRVLPILLQGRYRVVHADCRDGSVGHRMDGSRWRGACRTSQSQSKQLSKAFNVVPGMPVGNGRSRGARGKRTAQAKTSSTPGSPPFSAMRLWRRLASVTTNSRYISAISGSSPASSAMRCRRSIWACSRW